MQIVIDTVQSDPAFSLRVLAALVEGTRSGLFSLPSGYNSKRYFEFEGRWFTVRATTTGFNIKEARESITTLQSPQTARRSA